jgi:arabinogalactan oligomer/maltooligosaccharide transport system permease protein
VLIIPYAVPAFLSLLVWQGLLNDDFGVVNHIFHAHIPWLLGSAWWARVSVILVSMWLTFRTSSSSRWARSSRSRPS